ncbi:hypothetical protein HPB47_010400 [Ixodes persulcatus]|uniref:Uncharacterized protein n=1 Tax=Ixodes persulcatus TaxID=34615 RepID=A0AC60NZ67_IXOPE|nr:hypothetical protein HPB47_010400 [Ixodes persulcatus]
MRSSVVENRDASFKSNSQQQADGARRAPVSGVIRSQTMSDHGTPSPAVDVGDVGGLMREMTVMCEEDARSPPLPCHPPLRAMAGDTPSGWAGLAGCASSLTLPGVCATDGGREQQKGTLTSGRGKMAAVVLLSSGLTESPS